MVFCVRKFNGAVDKDINLIKIRKMKHFNEEAFLADVSGICWERLLNDNDDINVLVKKWSGLFSMVIDKYLPLCNMRV